MNTQGRVHRAGGFMTRGGPALSRGPLRRCRSSPPIPARDRAATG